MSTSAEQIAAMIASGTALKEVFEGKDADINAALATALAAAPQQRRSFYVNMATGGDDVLRSGSQSEPLATIQEAVARTPETGLLTLYISGNYLLDVDIPLGFRALILANDASDTGTLDVAAVNAVSGSPYAPGFNGHSWSPMCSVHFREISINLRAGATGKPAIQRGVVRHSNNLNFSMRSCTVTKEAGTELSMCSQHGTLTLFASENTLPADFSGHWVANHAAFTDPQTVRGLTSNLASL